MCSSKLRPTWAIYCYGKKNAEQPAFVNPWEELAALQQDALAPLKSLPSFLDKVVNGTAEIRTMLILGLHKKLFHMNAADLRRALHKAGVPLNVLVFVDDAVASCETCRAFAAPSARPNVKLLTAVRFNHTI